MPVRVAAAAAVAAVGAQAAGDPVRAQGRVRKKIDVLERSRSHL